MKIGIFLSSVRPGRMADRVYTLVKQCLENKVTEIVKFDPLERNLPLLDTPIHWYPDQSKAAENVKKLNEDVKSCDSFIFLTAEYNRSIPPALSNMLNYVCPLSFAYKPSGIVSYSQGPGGGSSVHSQIRDILSELGCLTMPDAPIIPMVSASLSENGEPVNDNHLKGSIERLIDQISFVTEAMISQRTKVSGNLPKLHAYI